MSAMRGGEAAAGRRRRGWSRPRSPTSSALPALRRVAALPAPPQRERAAHAARRGRQAATGGHGGAGGHDAPRPRRPGGARARPGGSRAAPAELRPRPDDDEPPDLSAATTSPRGADPPHTCGSFRHPSTRRPSRRRGPLRPPVACAARRPRGARGRDAGGWWLGGVGDARRTAAAAPQPIVVRSAACSSRCHRRLDAGARPRPASEARRSWPPSRPPPACRCARCLIAGLPADASLVPAALRSQLPAELPAAAPHEARRAGRRGPTARSDDGEARDRGHASPRPRRACSPWRARRRPATWNAAIGCEAGVRSIGAAGDNALAPAPDLAFRQLRARRAPPLDGKRVAGRAALARGRRPRSRGASPRRTARRPQRSPRSPLPASTTDAVAALRRTAAGYDALARAAGRARFIAARKAVVRAEAGLAGALKRLR